MKRKHIYILWLLLLIFFSCKQNEKEKDINAAWISNAVNSMTVLMVHDITNPPLASRFFAYSTLAGYEIVSQNNPSLPSLRGILINYPVIPEVQLNENYNYRIAAIYAILEVAGRMQPSGSKLDSTKAAFTEYLLKGGFSENKINISQQYAIIVADSILMYAKRDGYSAISIYPRYTPVNGDSYWQPTPPAYMAALEPYFNKVQTFYNTSSQIDGLNILKPSVFSLSKQSEFYRLMHEVYEESKTLTQEKKDIANFWDCNPFALLDNGHLQIGVKKISPGAHWMGIVSLVCNQSNISFDSTMLVHTITATAMMDAFILCWQKKYESSRVRPETAIRKNIDLDWKPLLQTPPFPEFPSGHSVVSYCSAEILSHFFGDSLSFADNVELPYGLPVRKFLSFRQAANEAAISRFYGGIHYMDGIEEGKKMGIAHSKIVLNKLTDKNR